MIGSGPLATDTLLAWSWAGLTPRASVLSAGKREWKLLDTVLRGCEASLCPWPVPTVVTSM